MNLAAILRTRRNLHRLREIVGVLMKYGLADWMSRVESRWGRKLLGQAAKVELAALTTEERIRRALEELGPTFIKAGQILSTRPDIAGPALAVELARLQASAPADTFEQVRQTIRAETGKDPHELFAEFSETPLASASIAQVHRAKLKDGREVVVKVQHAGIEQVINNDLEILMTLARLAERYAEQLRSYQPVATARQLRDTLLRELDFSRERRNLDQFNRNFADDKRVRFPRPVAELSKRRILTMDLLRGRGVNDTQALRDSGHDPAALATTGAQIFLDMLFRDGFYHADPHPGNFLAMSNGVIGILDGGMVGRLDEELRLEFESLVFAAMQGEARELTDVIIRVGSPPDDLDADALRTDANEFLGEHLSQSLDELDLGAALSRLTEIIRQHRVLLPPPISLVLRMLIVLEGTGRQLNPRFKLAEIIQPYYEQAATGGAAVRSALRNAQRSWRDWYRLAGTLPRDLAEMIRRIRAGTFTVHLEHRHLDPIVNRLAFAILTAALVISATQLWTSMTPPVLWKVPLLGLIGYLLALYFGWRLMRGIHRSGDVDSED